MEEYLVLSSLDELPAVAKKILAFAAEKRLLAFYGKMGAGKTTLIKEVCKQLGIESVVTSPTFALVNEYRSKNQIVYHFDFYRINKIEEIFDIGYEEYFYSERFCFIEWPELAESLLPDEIIRIKIAVDESNKRFITLSRD